MRYFTMFVCFITLSISSFAQKGSVYLGGDVGIFSIKQKNSASQTEIEFSPEVGTFFSDNIQVGVALNLRSNSDDNTALGVTPYARHFFKVGQAFRPFIGAGIPLRRSKNGNLDIKTTTAGLALSAGFGYALAPRWTVIGNLGFMSLTRQSFKQSGGPRVSGATTFNLGANTLGSPFNVGFYYTIKQ
jgi:opacity protein-like surface antigen